MKFLSMLGDGEGNLSVMRFAFLLIIVSVIASKFVNAYITGQPIVWGAQDFELVGMSYVAKLVQNTQEKQASPPTPKA